MDARYKKCDVLLLAYAGGLAGGGTRCQIVGAEPEVRRLCENHNVEFASAWSDNEVNGLPKPTIELELRGSNIEKHAQARQFAEQITTRWPTQRIGVFCFGYTSFLPYGFLPYRKDPYTDRITLSWADCSPPDTDELGADLSSRFFGSAYEHTQGILWGWHDSLPASRVPSGCAATYWLNAQPFSRDYVDYLRKQRERRRVPAGASEPLRVVLSASDIWSPSAIGQWMTAEQHMTVIQRTRALVTALRELGRSRGAPVTVYADAAIKPFTDSTLDWRFGTHARNEYHQLLHAADLSIMRASHSVTSAEAAAMGIPQLLLPMPGDGYMNIDDFTQDIRRKDLACVPEEPDSAEAILAAMLELLKPDRRATIAENARCEFDRVNARHNFFHSLAHSLYDYVSAGQFDHHSG